jgi:uncharacterized small protein (DUF1192 family)
LTGGGDNPSISACPGKLETGFWLVSRSEVRDMRTQSTAGQRTMDEEAPVKKKTVHEIGQDLSLLSVDELSERIELLQQEITRIEAARKTKQASRAAADQFFKK